MATIEELDQLIAQKQQAAQSGVTLEQLDQLIASKEPTESQVAQQKLAQETGGFESAMVAAGREFEKVPAGFAQIMMNIKSSNLQDKIAQLQPLAEQGDKAAQDELLNAQNELGTIVEATGLQQQEEAGKEQLLAPLRKENPVSTTIGAGVGGAAALPLPGLGPAKLFGSKLLGTAVREATTGALSGGLQFTPEGQSRLDNAMLGGILGGVIGPVSEAGIDFVRAGLRAKFGKVPDNISSQDINEILKVAEQQGIPIRAEDLSENAFVKQLAESFEASPGGFRTAKEQQVLAQKTAAERLQESVAGGITDPDTVVQKSLQNQFKKVQNTKRALFNKADKVLEGLGDIPRIETDKTLREVAKSLQQIPENLRDQGLVKEFLNIVNTPPGDIKTAKAMINRLENLEDGLFSGENQVIGKNGVQFITPIRQAIQEDVNNFVDTLASQGNFNAARAKTLRSGANKFFKEKVLPFKKTQLKKLVNDEEPENIVNFLLANTTDQGVRSSRAKLLFNSLGKEGKDAVKSSMINRAVTQASSKSGGAVQFDVRRFNDSMNNLSNATDIFFSKKEKQFVDGLQKVFEATTGAPRALGKDVPEGTLGQLAAMLVREPVAKLFGSPLSKNLIAGLGRVEPDSPTFQRLIDSLLRVTTRQARKEGERRKKLAEEGVD